MAAAFLNVPIAAQTVDRPAYTIQANARVVLTDVVVLDKNGSPVRGLQQSAFHVLDNGKPQEIRSFEEHSGPAPVEAAAADASLPTPGSNEYLRHPLPVYNVVMLDTSTMDVLDQMYLNQQIVKFIDSLPPGQPLAIYVHNGDVALQLQNFTADHDLLLNAVRKAIPKLRQPGAYQLSDQDALKQMAMYLAQLPGRKNLLWFTGGSNLFLLADATDLASGDGGGSAGAQAATPAPGLTTGQTLEGQIDMRETFDRLEAARIAVYPIDIRGLTASSDAAMDAQQTFMEEQAESTGGQAFFNTNGLTQVARRVIADDNSFYTLTYTPKDFKVDDKWHRVKVSVDGGDYRLSYRKGYYGDSGKLDDEKPGKPLLTKAGESIAAPEDRSQPILFEASAVAVPLQPGAPTAAEKHGELSYKVHYIVPAGVFQTASVADGAQVRIGAGVLAFDADGHPVQHKIQEVKLTFDDTILKTRPQSKLAFDEAIDLPKGSNYLYVVVWDMATGKMGTLQLPVQVAKR